MIRPFLDGDADDCRQIIVNCFMESVDYDSRIKDAILDIFLAEGYLEAKARQCPLFVCERDEGILGMGGIEENEIKRMYVTPKYQGQGIGREILHFLERFAIEKGISEVVLHSLPNAAGFYQREGYLIVGTHYYEHGQGLRQPTTEMKKVLVM